MKQNEIGNLPPLESTRYENIFNVYRTRSGHYYYNLAKTISFPDNVSDEYFDLYELPPGTYYTTLSYNIYGTIDLWWLILIANNIRNPMAIPTGTTILRVVKPSKVQEVLDLIAQN